MSLESLGWNSSLEQFFVTHRADGLCPARVLEEHRERYLIETESGVLSAEVTGKLRFTATSRLDFPTVGDWVAIQSAPSGDLAVIHAVLPRKTVFLRKVAGEVTEAQPVAANVDTILVVTDADTDFNLRRIERYLMLVFESGAEPVIVVNKADLVSDIDQRVLDLAEAAPGVLVFPVSAVTGQGFGPLSDSLAAGKTVALIGSSGVGKSSIINRLLGEERIKTNEVRESDGRGRHTTTFRQLILLPTGAIVIDTPGMREIQLWGDEESLAGTFEDVEQLTLRCRFSDCTHNSEPGCAVQAALNDGTLHEDRYESYRKLRKELRHLEVRQNIHAARAERELWKKRHREGQERMRLKYGGRK
jgi:ribosome biogenesis GTPase / thiamine phosphate phosphatase